MKVIKRRKTWEPPVIIPHRLGTINKYGNRVCRDEVEETAFGVRVDELLERYGSPLFVTSETKIRSNVRRLKRIFESRYSPVIHAWSYKTNYTSAVCNIMHQESSWAEVVSSFEYDKARALGVPGERIIFNGPNKSKAALERAVAEGAHIHVDHMDEIKLLESVAQSLGKIVEVTMRLNFDTGYTEPWCRFGFNIESGQAQHAAGAIAVSPHLKLTGLHSHIGTFITEPRAYEAQVRIMAKFMRTLEDSSDVRIDFFDIGGGFPSINSLKSIYLPPEQVVPDLTEYADLICGALSEETRYRKEQGRPLPMLILESGRAMIDDAQVLLSTVVGRKRLPDGRRALVLDAGTNTLFTAYWYHHKVKVTRPVEGVPEDTVLYGPLCMNIDVMRSSIQLPPVRVGDSLMFKSVGAYNNTQWMQFIEYRPAVVLIDTRGECSTIRRRENLEVMCAQDILPSHLKSSFKSS